MGDGPIISLLKSIIFPLLHFKPSLHSNNDADYVHT